MPLSEAELAQIAVLANQATSKVQSILSARQQKELEAEHAQAVMREETLRLFTEVVVPTLQAYVEARRSGPAYLLLGPSATRVNPPSLRLTYHPEDPAGTAMGPLNIIIGFESNDAFRLVFECDCTFASGLKYFYLGLDMMTPVDIIAKLHQIFQRWDDQEGF